jgi:hypothetical protein
MASFDPDIPGGAPPSRLPVSYSVAFVYLRGSTPRFIGIRRRFEMGTPFTQSCRTKLFRALSETETKGIIENRHDGVNQRARS